MVVQLDATKTQTIMELGYDSQGSEITKDHPPIIDPSSLKFEYFRHGDDLAFHTLDLLDAGYPALAILHALCLDDDIQRGGDIGPHRADRDLEIGHHDHGFQP